MMPHHPAFDFLTEPCEAVRFKGRRVDIEQVLSAVQQGWSRTQLLYEFKGVLTEEEIDIVLTYAATYPAEVNAYMARMEEQFRQLQLRFPQPAAAERIKILKAKYSAMAALEGVDFMTVFKREQYQLAGDLHE